MCDVNEGSKHWLCRILGHKHKRHGLGWSQLVPSYCVRCYANAVTPQGDGAIWCRIFGHQNYISIIGDYSDQNITGGACWNCHAKV